MVQELPVYQIEDHEDPAYGDVTARINVGVTTDPEPIPPFGAAANDLSNVSPQLYFRADPPSGTSDDSALFAAMEARLPATGGVVRLQAAAYYLPNGYTFTKPVLLVGSGRGDVYGWTSGGGWPGRTVVRGSTTILCSSQTASALTFNGQGSGVVDVAIVYTNAAAATAGAALTINAGHLFFAYRCGFVGFYDNVVLTEGALWTFDDCWFRDPVRFGLNTSNVSYPDEGDNTVFNCKFYATAAGPVAAYNWSSGGGLRFQNNKINGSWSSGVQLAPADGTNTVIALIEDNSIENCTVAVNLQRPAGGTTGQLALIEVQGNEIACNYGVLVQSQGFSDLHVADNIFTKASLISGVQCTYMNGANIGTNTFAVAPSSAGVVMQVGTSGTIYVDPQIMLAGGTEIIDNTSGGIRQRVRSVSGVSPDKTGAVVLPNYGVSINLHLTPAILSAGTWNALTYAGYSTAGATNTPYTQTWVTQIGPGTWAFDVTLTKLTNGAICNIDYSLDGGTTWVSIAAGVDTYAASGTNLVLSRKTGVVVTATTEVQVRVTGTGTRNASNTTGYYAFTDAFQAQRTA